MAGFCRNCGSPLDDTQAFCAKCGTPISGSPVRPPASAVPASTPAAPRPPAAAPSQPRPSAPPPTPQAVAAAPAKSSNTLVKVLLIFLVVIFLFGAIGVAGLWYVAHRVKEKVHEIGLDQISTDTPHGPVLGGANPCSLLSKADVSQAVNVEIVRAERSEGSDVGCEYSVMGNYVDNIAKHASLLHKADTNEQSRQMIETFAKGVGHSNDSQQSAPKHPGEAPIFMFSVDNNNAAAQMSLSRATFGRIGPSLTPLSNIGDDAFDIANGMIFVRKGDKLLRIIYLSCPCTTDDVVPLVRKLAANM